LEIEHRHLTDRADLEAMCDGVELVSRLMREPELASTLESAEWMLPSWQNRDELRERVRAHVGTTFHPSGTCRMGPATDQNAVVDHAGRVHGASGLRVADASIFPSNVRANLHCTVVAVAEHLAQTIKDECAA
jgi:choline dehydrogenase-like flavoprotein